MEKFINRLPRPSQSSTMHNFAETPYTGELPYIPLGEKTGDEFIVSPLGPTEITFGEARMSDGDPYHKNDTNQESEQPSPGTPLGRRLENIDNVYYGTGPLMDDIAKRSKITLPLSGEKDSLPKVTEDDLLTDEQLTTILKSIPLFSDERISKDENKFRTNFPDNFKRVWFVLTHWPDLDERLAQLGQNILDHYPGFEQTRQFALYHLLDSRRLVSSYEYTKEQLEDFLLQGSVLETIIEIDKQDTEKTKSYFSANPEIERKVISAISYRNSLIRSTEDEK